MAKIHQTLLVAGLSTVCLVSLTPVVAYSSPLNDLENIFNAVTKGIEKAGKVMGTATNTIDVLNKTLGISGKPQDAKANTTEAVLQSYATWHSSLSASEQEIVAWLVLESAKGKSPLALNPVANTPWFQQKSSQEQQKVGSLLFKLNRVLEVVGVERDQFFAVAFCLNSGSKNCMPKAL
jgi:hypothetical protein